jgi:hypothetical protein
MVLEREHDPFSPHVAEKAPRRRRRTADDQTPTDDDSGAEDDAQADSED